MAISNVKFYRVFNVNWILPSFYWVSPFFFLEEATRGDGRRYWYRVFHYRVLDWMAPMGSIGGRDREKRK